MYIVLSKYVRIIKYTYTHLVNLYGCIGTYTSPIGLPISLDVYGLYTYTWILLWKSYLASKNLGFM